MRSKTRFGVTTRKEILGSQGALEDVVTSVDDQKAEEKEVVKEEEVALDFVRKEKEKARKERKGVLTPQMMNGMETGTVSGRNLDKPRQPAEGSADAMKKQER